MDDVGTHGGEMFGLSGEHGLPQQEAESRREVMLHGANDGMIAGMIALRIGEGAVSHDELELRAKTAWGMKRLMAGGGPNGHTIVQDYVLCFCAAYQATSGRHQERLVPLPQLEPTLDALREYFEAPDLELPDDVEGVWLSAVEHVPSAEPFHLLAAAEGSFVALRDGLPSSLSDVPRTRGPILACKALAPNSAVLPTTNQAAWANQQVWLGEHRRGFALKR